MSNVTNKIFVDKMGGRSSTEYVGLPGEIFYDPTVGDLRLGDGRPGGRPVINTEIAPYRGFQAGCNQYLNGYGTNITQVVIHNASGRADYINYTDDTSKDDFYVTSLDNGQNDRAQKVIALNLYSGYSIDNNENKRTLLSIDNIRGFVRKFIDLVLYDMNDNAVNDLSIAKQAFYDNIDTLTKTLPNGTLFENFTFDDGGRVSWPEYNGPDGNATANFKIIQWPSYGGITYNDNSEVLMRSSGTGYKVGDKIVINGEQMFGKDGENDFTLEVTSLKSGNITGLTMTDGGSNYYPQNRIGHSYSNYSNSLNGGEGSDAQMHVNICDTSGAIIDWELTFDGYNYQVGDTLTLNYGGNNATFEVTSVGTDGINGFNVSGTSYLGSPARVTNGYWPKYNIDNGRGGQYSGYYGGNYLSTDRSSTTFLAHFDGNKMTIDDVAKWGTGLQTGMRGSFVVPWDNNPYQFTLISQASDNGGVWYTDADFSSGTQQVRFDNISYYNGQVNTESDEFNGQYVVTYDKGVFALMAFYCNINSFYYNGNTGNWMGQDGYKQTDVVMGAHGGPDSTIQIPLKRLWQNNYTIQTDDAGRSLFYDNGGSNQINIPADANVNFPIGTAITIISGGDDSCYIGAADTNLTTVWGAGFNQANASWYIPQNSMATIIKIAPDRWMLSGAGLGID